MKYKTDAHLVPIHQYSASVQAHIQVTVLVVQVVSLLIHQLIHTSHPLVKQHPFIQAISQLFVYQHQLANWQLSVGIALASALLFHVYFSPVVTNDTAVQPLAAALHSYVVSVAQMVLPVIVILVHAVNLSCFRYT